MKIHTSHPEAPGDAAASVHSTSEAARGSGSWQREGPARRGATTTGRLSTGHLPGVLKAIQTIRNEYSRPLTVSKLARECGLSERSLHRLYRSVTGNTVGKDLMARRIEAAAAMLRKEDVKLEPVAIESGLGTAKNLCRLFKVHLGVTPGQWKESFHRQSGGQP
jgi:transcriptional regulator GlxA family with amidase domain